MHNIALLYHDIVPEGQFRLSGFQSPDADIYKLSCAEFEHHLREIERATKQRPALVSDAPVDANWRLLLTFDDGGVSASLYTADLLQKLGWRGHFFVTTDKIGTPGFLNEEQIRALHRQGHVIGSHSCSHPPRMSHCSRAQLDREWGESSRVLTGILGEPTLTASVPAGYHSRQVAEAAAAAGIRVLFTSEPVTSAYTVNGCVVLGRFGVQQGVPAEWVAAVVSGRMAPRVQRYLFWNGKKVLKTLGGNTWLSIRRKVLAMKEKRA